MNSTINYNTNNNVDNSDLLNRLKLTENALSDLQSKYDHLQKHISSTSNTIQPIQSNPSSSNTNESTIKSTSFQPSLTSSVENEIISEFIRNNTHLEKLKTQIINIDQHIQKKTQPVFNRLSIPNVQFSSALSEVHRNKWQQMDKQLQLEFMENRAKIIRQFKQEELDQLNSKTSIDYFCDEQYLKDKLPATFPYLKEFGQHTRSRMSNWLLKRDITKTEMDRKSKQLADSRKAAILLAESLPRESTIQKIAENAAHHVFSQHQNQLQQQRQTNRPNKRQKKKSPGTTTNKKQNDQSQQKNGHTLRPINNNRGSEGQNPTPSISTPKINGRKSSNNNKYTNNKKKKKARDRV